MTVTNTLAYNRTELITAVKSFVKQAPVNLGHRLNFSKFKTIFRKMIFVRMRPNNLTE
jgi:hypothetical protein